MQSRTLIFILLVSSFFTNTYSQLLFNKTYPLNLSLISNEMLHETSENYYSVGYAGLGPTEIHGFEIGVRVTKYDKKSGDTIQSAYFEVKDNWIFTSGRTPISHVNDDLVFGMSGNGVLYKLAYNLNQNIITIQDTVMTKLGGIFINDIILHNDTTIYHATILLPEENINSVIYSYPDKTRKFIYLPQKDANGHLTNYTGRRMYIQNDTLILFGSKYYKGLSYVTFIKANMQGDIISEIVSTDDFAWKTNDVLRINQDEYLVLAYGEYKDPVKKIFDLIHIVYRVNMKTNKIIWRVNYAQPTAEKFTTGGDIIPGHKPNEYLYCTKALGAGSTKDTSYYAGRVVKIDGNGKLIWHKDYWYSSGKNHNNNPYTLIATSDGNYLMGGDNVDRLTYKGWLVKFDENGNIVPIDTTSVSTEIIKDIPDITIYPNPAHDYIIINQGEQTDMTYSIYDMNGRQVMVQKLDRAHLNTVWDISALECGTFVLVISQKGKIMTSRQIVKL